MVDLHGYGTKKKATFEMTSCFESVRAKYEGDVTSSGKKSVSVRTRQSNHEKMMANSVWKETYTLHSTSTLCIYLIIHVHAYVQHFNSC